MPKLQPTDRELLESIHTAVIEQAEQLEDLRIKLDEALEKIDNISTPGVDYGYEE